MYFHVCAKYKSHITHKNIEYSFWKITSECHIIFHLLMKGNSKRCWDIKLSAKLISKRDSFSTLKIQGNFEKSFVHLLKLIGPCLEHKMRWNRACSSGKTATLSIYSLSFYVKADKRGTKTIILCSLTSWARSNFCCLDNKLSDCSKIK